MTLTTRLGFSAASLVLSMLAVTGCKKDEPPPPLPSAAPVATAPAPLQLKPEDAGVVAPVDAGKKKTGGAGGGGIAACCKALMQNAQSAPEPTKTYMLQAGAMCQATQGAGRAALGPVLAALRGAGVPAACK
jgi:hypothetical protein